MELLVLSEQPCLPDPGEYRHRAPHPRKRLSRPFVAASPALGPAPPRDVAHWQFGERYAQIGLREWRPEPHLRRSLRLRPLMCLLGTDRKGCHCELGFQWLEDLLVDDSGCELAYVAFYWVGDALGSLDDKENCGGEGEARSAGHG